MTEQFQHCSLTQGREAFAQQLKFLGPLTEATFCRNGHLWNVSGCNTRSKWENSDFCTIPKLFDGHELNRATLFKSSGRLYIYSEKDIKHLPYAGPSFEQHILNVSSLGLTQCTGTSTELHQTIWVIPYIHLLQPQLFPITGSEKYRDSYFTR